MNHYTDVFLESGWAATVLQAVCSALFFLNHLLLPSFPIIPGLPSSEPTIFAMKEFGGYNLHLACALGMLGATAGQFSNWVLGRVLVVFKQFSRIDTNDRWYVRSIALFSRYGLFLLLFSWIPLLNLFVVMAGMANTPLRLVLPLLFAGQILYYGQYLL